VKRIMNIDEVELQPRPPQFTPPDDVAERFDVRMGQIAAHIGAEKLGYNLTVVPPGKRAFPYHSHLANEEMFFVIEGRGEIRIGGMTQPIRKGDVIACPPGDRDTAHQIVNTGDEELMYLAISTRISPEVCEYPDSDKYAVLAQTAAGADGKPGMFRVIGRPSDKSRLLGRRVSARRRPTSCTTLRSGPWACHPRFVRLESRRAGCRLGRRRASPSG
jgi:uncharacterized cupin superfamily protein